MILVSILEKEISVSANNTIETKLLKTPYTKRDHISGLFHTLSIITPICIDKPYRIPYLQSLFVIWCNCGVVTKLRHPQSLDFTSFYLSKLFIVGNNNTSLIAGLFVIIITILSIPNPIPPVGGIPIDKAFKKSSSV